MDLDQDIQVINSKDKNVSPEERHKWMMPEIPPVPKGYKAPFILSFESPEAEITSISVFRPDLFPAGNNRDIPISLQELIYGSKSAGVETSANFLDRNNEL
ncbi:hypothetical protein O181_057492 [Austropuccinia psidii MF-1]|uniref:Uncharacterized protein n=1 Tax=Austropuccinia psidii MF-1 TaxID=1389203 RepID=A0A9Q3ECV5_9BASI|nr:hypothetical protein [Austropuccinia psidii MF-1]